MQLVYRFIDDNFGSFLSEFRESIRKPGISTENTGIDETVSWLVSKMKENKIKSVEIYKTKRHPIILGRTGTSAKHTLLVYGHYDVQPPGNRSDWKADPFAAEIIDDQVVGRGTSDMKNNLMASIQAVKAISDCESSLPINILFLFEGEEEIGSPSLKPFIEEHKTDLSVADSILCADGGGENKAGQALLTYGLKGWLSFQLSFRSQIGEIHSMYAGVSENPAWRIISALGCLKEGDKVLVPEFSEGAKQPSFKEKIKFGLAQVAVSKEDLEDAFEIRIRKGMMVSEALMETFYKPTLNISGLTSGYTEKSGPKTIIPENAWVRIESMFPPDQNPSIIFSKIEKHLRSKGFDDMCIEKEIELPAYKVDPDEKISQVIFEATKKIVSHKTMEIPILPGAGAMVWLPHILNKPMAIAGSGSGYMAHRANEFIKIDQYRKGIKLFATIYKNFAS